MQELKPIYLQLIDWDQQHHAPVVDLFQNNKSIAEFMGLWNGIPQRDHKAGFFMELEQGAYFGGEIASSGHKNEMKNLNIKMRSPRKNHNVALSDYEKGKKKDVS